MSKIDEKPVKTDIKTIRKAFDALSFVTGGSCRDFVADFLAQCKQEEKSHRGWGPSFDKYHPNAATIADCAKLFAVKRVAEIMTTGTLSQYESLARALNAFHAADIARDNAMHALREAALAADANSIREPSLVAWAERRCRVFLESVG